MAEVTTERLVGLMSEPGMSAKIAAAQQKADADERLAARRAIIAEKKAHAEEAQKELPQLSKTAEASKSRAGALKKAYDAGLDEHRADVGALLSATGKFERQQQRYDAQLLDDGDPDGRIKLFIEDLDVMWEQERKAPSSFEMRATGQFYRVTGNPETVAWSDHLSRARRLKAIRQAQADARALMLEALSPSEIIERLQAILASLPGVELENVSVAA